MRRERQAGTARAASRLPWKRKTVAGCPFLPRRGYLRGQTGREHDDLIGELSRR
jgi:hypothetical protein